MWVTGVQTCALPILLVKVHVRHARTIIRDKKKSPDELIGTEITWNLFIINNQQTRQMKYGVSESDEKRFKLKYYTCNQHAINSNGKCKPSQKRSCQWSEQTITKYFEDSFSWAVLTISSNTKAIETMSCASMCVQNKQSHKCSNKLHKYLRNKN